MRLQPTMGKFIQQPPNAELLTLPVTVNRRQAVAVIPVSLEPGGSATCKALLHWALLMFFFFGR